MEPRIWPNIFQSMCFWACLGLSSYALAEIELVQITPAQPTEHDTVSLTVIGGLSDACWSVQSYDFGEYSPRQFTASMFAVDIWEEGMGCATIIVPYHFTETLGPLDPGTYTVSVQENHRSQRDPWPNSETFTLEVVEGLQRIQDLTVIVIGSDIALHWSAVDGATSYNVYRRNEFDLDFEFATLLDSTVTPGYTDSNAVALPSSKYFYNVTATE